MRRLMLERSYMPRCLAGAGGGAGAGARALNPAEKDMRDWIGEVRREDVRGTQATVARLKIDSPIMHEPSGWDLWAYTPTDRVVDAINKAAADRTIDVIVLELDCPGGTVAGWSDIAEAIDAARVEKGVVALVHEHAYSLAMRMAVRCEEIVATPTGYVGSIGTLVMMYDESALYAEAGVIAKPVGSDDFKAIGYGGVPITEEYLTHVRESIVKPDYAAFVNEVATGRGLTEEAVRAMGSLCYPAAQALQLGLIDRIATAEAYVAELANGTNQQNNPRPATSDGSGSKGVTMDLAQLKAKHPELVQEIEKSTRSAMETEVRAQLVAAAAGPATFEELNAAFGADPAFVTGALAGKKNMSTCRAEWDTKQTAERAALTARAETAEKRVKELEALPAAGNQAVSTGGDRLKGGAAGNGGANGGASGYEARVQALVAGGTKPAAAHAQVQKDHPKEYAEYAKAFAPAV